MREQKRITVFCGERCDGEWPPTNLTECVAWFSDKLTSIPDEHKATAKVEFDSESGYYASIEIYYYRPETDDEMVDRESKELRRQETMKARELRTLAELKAKYG